MASTAFTRAPAFDSLEDMLNWAERNGGQRPVVERGPDETYRGSVEVGEREEPEAQRGR
jgi:hypothetical protein